MKKMSLYLLLPVSLAVAAMTGFAEPAEVDLDLSVMPASIAYAQMTAMQREPEAWIGQTLRIAGIFNDSEARQKGVVIVADRAGCCETSLDFICAEPFPWPDDYPELYSRIVLVGRYEPSAEGTGACCLTDAVIEVPWQNKECGQEEK